jgi:hypothetical protein
MKTISDLALAALERGDVLVSGAVEIVSDEPIRVWGGYAPVILDGDQFEPVGDRGLVQVMGGALGDSAQGISLTLSGIDAETLALLEADEVAGAPVVLWRLIFNAAGDTALDAQPWSRGRLDTLESDEEVGGDAAIIAKLETPARGLGRRGARMRSDADQRLIDPNDGFFKNVAFAGERQLYWGGRRPSTAGSVVNGGNVGRSNFGPGAAINARAN